MLFLCILVSDTDTMIDANAQTSRDNRRAELGVAYWHQKYSSYCECIDLEANKSDLKSTALEYTIPDKDSSLAVC